MRGARTASSAERQFVCRILRGEDAVWPAAGGAGFAPRVFDTGAAEGVAPLVHFPGQATASRATWPDALRGRLARRMRDEVDLFIVEISLHGACAETHDRQTRVPGSFARLVANLREVRELGLRVKLNSPLPIRNEHEIEAMYSFADGIGFPLDFDPQITRRDDGGPRAAADLAFA